ncbi:MAG TPA: LrgB family protein [Alphaproteobacteria bacterium]|nr:LrgB family protein [Alphaproteobacteria bacterium]
MILDSPLVLLGATLAAYRLGGAAQARLPRLPFAHPVPVAVAALLAALAASGLTADAYLAATAPLHGLLPLAIVALAVPLQRGLAEAGRGLAPLLATAGLGMALAAALGPAAGLALGLDPPELLALATRTASAPIALGVAERIGGDPMLTLLAVFATGMAGSAFGPALLRRAGVVDEAAAGLALGIVAHAFGVARAAEMGPRALAHATLGMGLTGLGLALLLPILA